MISPAIHFNGACLEAMSLYEEAFHGTDKFVSLYDEAPADSGLNARGDMYGKVMHAGMNLCGTVVNFSDDEEPIVGGGNQIRLNIFTATAEEVAHAYETLRVGGAVRVALGPQFFTPMYAALVDRYGVYWQIICG